MNKYIVRILNGGLNITDKSNDNTIYVATADIPAFTNMLREAAPATRIVEPTVLSFDDNPEEQ